MRTRRWLAVLAPSAAALLVAAGYFAGKARAEGIPQGAGAMTYRGTLLLNGAPAPDGQRQMKVELFDDKTAGKSLCATSLSVLVQGGRFEVPLSADCVAAVHANKPAWVEVIVETEKMPRVRLAAVPYAVDAQSAAEAASAQRAQVVQNPWCTSGACAIGDILAVESSATNTTANLSVKAFCPDSHPLPVGGSCRQNSTFRVINFGPVNWESPTNWSSANQTYHAGWWCNYWNEAAGPITGYAVVLCRRRQ